jgi:hypothetical protein
MRTEGTRVYHLSPSRLWLIPGMWAAIVLPLLWLCAQAQTPGEAVPFSAGAAMVTVVFGLAQVVAWRSRLELSPSSIVHHQFGYTIRSPWDNVVAVIDGGGAKHLVLGRPGTRSALLRLLAPIGAAIVPGGDELYGDVQLLAEGRLITLEPFMAHWRRGPLREDLRRFAPHLALPPAATR